MADKYEKQKRWRAKHLKSYSVVFNLDTESDLAEFVEEMKGPMSTSDVFRLAMRTLKLVTHDMEILTRYHADNGDEFVRVRNDLIPQPNIVEGDVNCKAVWHKTPVEHLSYYTEDGEFIATAGTHIREKLGATDDLFYTKRVSEQTQNDNITKALGYEG